MFINENEMDHNLVYYDGRLVPQGAVTGMISHDIYRYSRGMTRYDSELHQRVMYNIDNLFNYNLVIPIKDLVENRRRYQKDIKGCRIIGHKVINNQQLQHMLGYKNRMPYMQVAICPEITTTKCVSKEFRVTPIETYDKILNVSYLVDDEFLHKWNHGLDTDNIANKIVKDCSVQELLFAIKQKLEK